MTRAHGRLAVLWIDDQGGTCRNLSADYSNITFNRGKNLAETTTFGDNSVQREVDGLRDASIDVSAIWNVTATTAAVVGLLDEMYSGSLVSRIQYLPAGSISGSPIYTASMALTAYNVAEPVDGVTTGTFTLALATGSVTQACAV